MLNVARGGSMVNLESETPYFYWTFDDFDDLTQEQAEYGFEGSVWKSDLIPSYVVGEAHLTFDSPAEWGLPSVTFRRTPGGRYEHRSDGIVYDAVRADIQTHVVLTGRWTQTGYGKGVFIAVFPVKHGVEVLLKTAATMPVESHIPELVSGP